MSVSADSPSCYGSYQQCPVTNLCVLNLEDCVTNPHGCSSGQYLCPLSRTCFTGSAAFVECGGLTGTVWDWNATVSVRVGWLLQHATLPQKAAQLVNDAPSIPELSVPEYNWLNDNVHDVQSPVSTIFPDGCGLGATWDRDVLFNGGFVIGVESRATYNDDVHKGDRGFGQNGAGITIYSPNINLVRDPRWGRAQEVYGEDPFLTGSLSVSYVKGVQGANSSDYASLHLASANCKHFAVYDLDSIPENRMMIDALTNQRNMWESYLPAFEDCVIGAGADSVMTSYVKINGVPASADKNLLSGLLMGKWNFSGFVIGDYDAWANIYDTQKWCMDLECAAAAGLNAGMHQEGGGNSVANLLPKAIADGLTTEALVDDAFARLFRIRVMLGMFDPPNNIPYNQYTVANNVLTPVHTQLSLEAAEKSICMYKNDGVLPLNNATIKSLGVIGYHATASVVQLGNYDQQPGPDQPGPVTILQGLFDYMNGAPFDPFNKYSMCPQIQQNVSYFAPGQPHAEAYHPEECCFICTAMGTAQCQYWTWSAESQQCYFTTNSQLRRLSNYSSEWGGSVMSMSITSNNRLTFSPGCSSVICNFDDAYLSESLAVASQSDVIVMTFGLDGTLEAEFLDRGTYDLPAGQYQLLSDIAAKNPSTPIICVLIHGGTFTLNNLWTQCSAILDAWYPGMMGGPAVANTIFGANPPAGRSIQTWYTGDGDLPNRMNQMDWYPIKPAPGIQYVSQGLSYRYYQGTNVPLVPFGFGLSYTSFAYENLTVTSHALGVCEHFQVSVNVINLGKVTSDEVVQVYLSNVNPSVPAPNIRLAGFERAHDVAPGQAVSLTFDVHPKWFSVVANGDSQDIYTDTRMVEANMINVFVGGGQPNSAHTLSAQVRVATSYQVAQCGY